MGAAPPERWQLTHRLYTMREISWDQVNLVVIGSCAIAAIQVTKPSVNRIRLTRRAPGHRTFRAAGRPGNPCLPPALRARAAVNYSLTIERSRRRPPYKQQDNRRASRTRYYDRAPENHRFHRRAL